MSWLAGISIDNADNDNLGVDWVLQYEFGDLGMSISSLQNDCLEPP